MVHRLKLLISVLCLLAMSQAAFGLGLGEVTLLSKLNQPLDAEIELLEVRDLNENEILIGLASRDDFVRIGVERPYFLTDLVFTVDLNASNGPRVKIKSKKLVREPFLNFIVQAQWPSGKILREYTLLLDLPVFSDQQSASVNVPSAAPTAAPNQPSQPTRSQNTRSSFGQSSTSSNATSTSSNVSPNKYNPGDTTAPVSKNQTLWEIALDVRPNSSYSVQQTMLAIQRLNPDAFINNNINLLKTGQVLRIPSADQITQNSQSAAVSAVAQQNAQWSDGSEEYGAQLSARQSDGQAESVQQAPSGRLKLVSPDSSSDSNAGKSSGSGDSRSQALENELAVTLDELERTKRNNSDLRSKVESLEEQIETLESLIKVTNEDMRALELSASKKDVSETADADLEPQINVEIETPNLDIESPEVEGIENDIDAKDLSTIGEPQIEGVDDTLIQPESDLTKIDSEINDSIVESDDVVAPVAETVADEPKKAEPAVVRKNESKKSFLDIIIDNIIYIGIALIAIIGGLVFWLQTRSHDDDFDDDDFLNDEDTFVSPELNDDDAALIEEDDTTVIQHKDSVMSEPDEFEDRTSEAQTGDAAGESEIYISLGQYEQAEDILVNALDHDDNDQKARLKLLEVYAAQNNAVKFDEQFAKIYANADAESIERAQSLRGSIDGIGEFDADNYGSENIGSQADELASLSEQTDAEDSFSLDIESADSSVDETGDDLSLDFDLDLDEKDVDSSLAELDESLDSTSENADTDLSLNLDDELSLDLDDELSLDTALDDNADDLMQELDELSSDDTQIRKVVDLSESQTIETPAVTSNDLEDDLDLSEEVIQDDLSKDKQSMDFDLGLEDLDLSDTGNDASVTLEDDIAALDAELDLDDLDMSLDSDSSTTTETLDELATDVDLSSYTAVTETDDELSLLDDEIEGDSALDDLDTEVEELSAELHDNAPSSMELENSDKSDNLDGLDESDASLADLDSELDALDLDLDDDNQSSDSIPELTLSPEDTSESEDDLALETLETMEEPVTDFGEFDDLDDSDEDASQEDETDDNDMGDDTLFTQAISEVSDDDIDLTEPDEDADDDGLGFLNDSDEIATKLDLARAYIDMGDREGAKDIIDEIQKEGNDQQKEEADKLLARLND